MESEQLSPFDAIVDHFLTGISMEIGRPRTPCTPINQRVRLVERISHHVIDSLAGLKNQYYAELTMLPPSQTKSSLLDRLIAEATIKLKERDDWVQIRLKDIEYVADQLVDLARQLYNEECQLAQQQGNTDEESVIYVYDDNDERMSWPQFFEFISTDLAYYQTAFLHSAYIDWLLVQYDSTDRSTIRLDPVAPKVTQAQRALYYVYLHTTLSEPDFAQHPEGKAAAIRYIADANLISAKNFEMTYNRLTKFSERTTKSMAATIKTVIAMLDNYPAARQKAEEELKIASTK